MNKLTSLISIVLLFSTNALAQKSNLWLRAMPPHMKMGSAFGEICNNSKQNVVVKSITSDYGKVEFHKTFMQNGMMKMKQIKSPSIKTKTCLTLKPGADHIMIMNIKKQASTGETRKFLIEFSNNTKIEVVAITRKEN